MRRVALMLGAVAGLACFGVWLRDRPRSSLSYQPLGDSKVLSFAGSLRPNYPYSVIPWGAYSAADLRDAVARDTIVRTHYAGFDLQNARLVKLTHDSMQYVSFRQNGKVFWTRKSLHIVAGEVLLTDGRNFAKTRCGNRLSRVPMQPTTNSEVTAQTLSPPLLDDAPQPALQFDNLPVSAPVLLAPERAGFDQVSATPLLRLSSTEEVPAESVGYASSGDTTDMFASGGTGMVGGTSGFPSGGGYGVPSRLPSEGGVGLFTPLTGACNVDSSTGSENKGFGTESGGNSGCWRPPPPLPVQVVPEPAVPWLVVCGFMALSPTLKNQRLRSRRF